MKKTIIKICTFIFVFSSIFLISVSAQSNITNKDGIEITDNQGNVDIFCNISDSDTTLLDYHDNYEEVGYISLYVGETRDIMIEFGMSAYFPGRSASLFFEDGENENTFFSYTIIPGDIVGVFGDDEYDLSYLANWDYVSEKAQYAQGNEMVYSLEGLAPGINNLTFSYRSGNSGDTFSVEKSIPVIVYSTEETEKTISDVILKSPDFTVEDSLSNLTADGLSFYYPDSLHYSMSLNIKKFLNDTSIEEKFVCSSLDTNILTIDQPVSIATLFSNNDYQSTLPITLKGKKGSTTINIKRFIGDSLVEDYFLPINVYDTSNATMNLDVKKIDGKNSITAEIDFICSDLNISNLSYEWYINGVLESTNATNTYTFDPIEMNNTDIASIKAVIKDTNTNLRYLTEIPDKELTENYTSVSIENVGFYCGEIAYLPSSVGSEEYEIIGDIVGLSAEYLSLIDVDVLLESELEESATYSVNLKDGAYFLSFESSAVGTYYFSVIFTMPDNSEATAYLEIDVIFEDERWVPETSTALIYLDESDTTTVRIGYKRNGVFTPLTEEAYVLLSSSNPANIIPSFKIINGELVIEIVAKNKECEGYIYAMDGTGDGNYNNSAFSILVKVQKTRTNTATSYFEFEEGSKISLFLTDSKSVETTISIGGLIANLGLDFSWFCIGSDILKIEKISEYQVRIIPKAVGITKVVAVHTTDTGRTITGSIDVEIIEDIPTVSIDVTKAKDVTSLTSLSIYDTLMVKLNDNGFKFSNQTTYTWYLDGKLITNVLNENDIQMIIGNARSFRYKLSEAGNHTIKVSIVDAGYNFTVEEEQEISISKIENVQMKFSLNYDNTVYALLEGQEFNVDALLDGVVNKGYSYKWYISSPTVLKFLYDSDTSASAIVKPEGVGSTTLTVQCDIGRYGVSNVISKEITVIVEKFENFSIVSESDYVKPGQQGVFNVKINKKSTYVNVDIDAEAYLDGEKIDSVNVKGNKITVDELSSGKCSVVASFGKYNAKANIDVTNFNLKIFVKNVVPYLFISALVILVIAFIVKKRKTNLEKLDIKFKKIQEKMKLSLDKINADTKNTRAILRKYERRIRKICNACDYTIDTGIDELKDVLQLLEVCESILVAAIKVTDKDTKPTRNKLILKNLLNRNLPEIYGLFSEIYESREEFKKNILTQLQDPICVKEKKKKKMTPEEYQAYLQSYVIEEDDGDD